jgi:hypothetical protein
MRTFTPRRVARISASMIGQSVKTRQPGRFPAAQSLSAPRRYVRDFRPAHRSGARREWSDNHPGERGSIRQEEAKGNHHDKSRAIPGPRQLAAGARRRDKRQTARRDHPPCSRVRSALPEGNDVARYARVGQPERIYSNCHRRETLMTPCTQ